MSYGKDYQRLLDSFSEVQANNPRMFTTKLTRRGRRAKARAAKTKKK